MALNALKGRVSVIRRGIGLAAAKLFVQNGHRVVLSDLNLDEARSAFQGAELGDNVKFQEANVTDEGAVEAVFKSALTHFGRVDAAIINAGILDCASKWGVRGLSLTAAAEFGVYGIRANCIQPGATDTDMFSSFPPALQEAVKDSNVLKRVGQPNEVAEAMLWLASDKSSFVTGSTLAVHGGQTPT
ncbi:hypothetical protein RQP46_005222 [Phenoliferia psychrophenolica]